jgi:hypothetical protein
VLREGRDGRFDQPVHGQKLQSRETTCDQIATLKTASANTAVK